VGQIGSLTIPAVMQEAGHDLVRAREDVRVGLMTAWHRLSKLLLRQGIVYCIGQTWNREHRTSPGGSGGF
jgi:hypothetical protein